jgi:hypothetical protein
VKSAKMSGNLTHVLFENASGYALFEVTMQEEIVSLSERSERHAAKRFKAIGIPGLITLVGMTGSKE